MNKRHLRIATHSMKVFAFLLLSVLFPSLIQAAVMETLQNPALLATAKTLPDTGVLTQEQNGYTYLAVSEDYADKLYPLLHISGVNKRIPKLGVHITVITSEEAQDHNLFDISGLGATYTFKVIALKRAVTKRCIRAHDADKIWYVLAIESPEIMKLREKYGLSDKRYSPHISITSQQKIYFDKPCSIYRNKRFNRSPEGY